MNKNQKLKKLKNNKQLKENIRLKDYIVYPKHGVGQIQSVSIQKTMSVKLKFNAMILKFDKDKAIGLLLPINKQSSSKTFMLL